MIKLNSGGDTIVEVLVAIVVIGVVLSGAFVAVNRNSNTSLQVQERSQAIKIVETQLERLKGIASDPSLDVFNTATPRVFCLDGSLSRQNFSVAAITNLSSTNFDLNSDSLAAELAGNYPANCVVDSGGSTYGPSSQSVPFSVSIERTTADNHTFRARARWERAGGGRDEIAITYRLYE